MWRLLSLVITVLLLAACDGQGPGSTSAPTATGEPLVTADDTRATIDEATPTPSPEAAPTPDAEAAPTPTPAATSHPPLASRDLAEDPSGLAEQLAAAERAVRDETVEGQALDDAAFVQQAAYRHLAERADWHPLVAERMPDDLREAFGRNLTAAVALGSLTTPQEQLPDWRIVEAADAHELLDAYREAEAATGAPWAHLAAIHLVETRMGRIRGTSTAGAQGPMQFMPATWAHWGEGDVNDDRDAIMAAGRYLRDHGAPTDMQRALYAYNRSDRYVEAVDAYARVIADDPPAYRGYHRWQVYYRTVDGDVLLPVGYDNG